MLTVVVINKNRLNYLALKIASLRYQANFSDLDVLVVDYSDTNAVMEYCRKLKIRCVRVKGRFSISEARNVGIRYARTEWICISGNDTIVDRNYFAKLGGLIHSYQGQKVFFSGYYSHFVKKRHNRFHEKYINCAFSMYDLFRDIPPNKLLNRLHSLLISACAPWEDFGKRRWSIPNFIRMAGHCPGVRIFVFPILTSNLLYHLLHRSLQDDRCLAVVHDFIFSEKYLRPRQIMPYSFQTFTRSMAEELDGYDESFYGWGAEDDDFKKRAEFLGYRHVPSQLICLHLEHRTDKRKDRIEKKGNLLIMESRDRLIQPHWGLKCPVEEIC